MSNISSTRPMGAAQPVKRKARLRISLSAVAAALGLAATLWATLVGKTLTEVVHSEAHELASFRHSADQTCVNGIPRTVPRFQLSNPDPRVVAAAARVSDRLVIFAAARPPAQYGADYRLLIGAWRDLALGEQRAISVLRARSPDTRKAWEKQDRKIAASTVRIQAASLPMGLFGCSSRAARLQVAATQALVLGRFRTRGRFSAGTVRG